VLDIDYSSTFHPDSGAQLFKLVTNHGIHYSRTVIVAIGAGAAPRIPASMSSEPVARIQGACHAFAIETFPDPGTQKKINAKEHTNVLVVGGGLTSAQLTDMCIRHGVTKVWHIMRGPMKGVLLFLLILNLPLSGANPCSLVSKPPQSSRTAG